MDVEISKNLSLNLINGKILTRKYLSLGTLIFMAVGPQVTVTCAAVEWMCGE